MNKVVVLVAVLISFARGAAIGTKTTSTQISTLMSAFTPNTTSPGCIVFTEYVSGYSSGQSMYYSEPADGIAMPNSVVTKLLTTLKAQTKYRCIEIFGIEPTILSLARAQGFKVHGIIWLTLTTSANSVAISNAIRAAKAYPTSLLSLSCGSELAFRSGTGTTVTNIIKNCLASIRGAGITLPVGTQDSLRTFNNGWAAMTPYVDFFGVNM
jgi:exo-beta-1,3-glucanase (GH17 family)